MFDWYQGHIVSEAIGRKIVVDDEGEEEEATPSDSDLVQHDVVKVKTAGLLFIDS